MPILEVHADAENVLVELDGVIAVHCVDNYRRGSACHVKAATISVIAGRIAQIDKQIFSFERPMLGKSHFNPAADGPAEFRIGLIRQARQGSLYIRTGTAGSPVDRNAVARSQSAHAAFPANCSRSCSSIRRRSPEPWRT